MSLSRCSGWFVSVGLIGLIMGCDRTRTGTSRPSAGAVTPHEQAASKKHVYDESADARVDIEKAVVEARADGKRILLIFGANWCPECLILDARLHEPPSKAVVEVNFHVVDVDIGRGGDFLDGSPGKNQDLAKQYEIQLNLGVPAVAVLSPNGSLVYSLKDGEWTPVGSPSSTMVVEFLNRWKPTGR